MRVIVYTQAGCARCHAAVRWLGQMQVPFEIRDVYASPGALEELRSHGVRTLPAFGVGSEMIEGFDRMRVLTAWSGQENRDCAKVRLRHDETEERCGD